MAVIKEFSYHQESEALHALLQCENCIFDKDMIQDRINILAKEQKLHGVRVISDDISAARHVFTIRHKGESNLIKIEVQENLSNAQAKECLEAMRIFCGTLAAGDDVTMADFFKNEIKSMS